MRWTAAHQAPMSCNIPQILLKFMSFESLVLSNYLILCHLLLLFPPSGSFPMSWHYASGGQSIGSSASASVLPMNIQGLFPWGLTSLISLLSKGLASVLQHYNSKASILQHSVFFMVQLSYQYMTTGKTIALTIWTFVSKMMSLLFTMLSRFVTAFLPRSKNLLISWLQSHDCSDSGTQENKVCYCFHFLPFYLP